MYRNFSAWINALRLHTLPLSLSGVLLGNFLALYSEKMNYLVLIFSLSSAVLLQILANLANDLGDYLKGTDNNQRLGPDRVLQSGKLSKNSMKNALLLVSIFAFISGGLLIYFGLNNMPLLINIIFYVIGITAILAALNYTLGKNPYGYFGLGDFFVFIFFGLVSVIGTYFLNTHTFDKVVFYPACAIGFLSVAVINLNNLRDFKNDKLSGKKTLVVMLGLKNAKIYHTILILGVVIFTLFYLWQVESKIWIYIFLLLIIAPLLIKNLYNVYFNSKVKILITELKHLSLTTFLYAILLIISILL